MPRPPHFLNQAPPGAQQLTLPDLRNVPHLGHAVVRSIGGVGDSVLIGFLTMSSRSGFGRRDTYGCVICVVDGTGADVHAVRAIDPGEPSNMSLLLAFELTHSTPQSFWSNNAASVNILSILVTLDTSHLERSPLKDVLENIPAMSVTLDTSHLERSPLNDVASMNIPAMLATFETSHFERSR